MQSGSRQIQTGSRLSTYQRDVVWFQIDTDWFKFINLPERCSLVLDRYRLVQVYQLTREMQSGSRQIQTGSRLSTYQRDADLQLDHREGRRTLTSFLSLVRVSSSDLQTLVTRQQLRIKLHLTLKLPITDYIL